jgi:ribosome-binding protein aMBF1 (putative translation factor)
VYLRLLGERLKRDDHDLHRTKENRMNNLSIIIKTARVTAGLTQVDVSTELGLSSAQFISNIERGLANLPMKHARPLSRLLKIPLSAIIDARAEDVKERLRREVKCGNQKKRVS